jgi:hypothetical protein
MNNMQIRHQRLHRLSAGIVVGLVAAFAVILQGTQVLAQSVCLPAPRLLTMFPLGVQAGTSVEVAITGENLEELAGLFFSDPRIVAEPVLSDKQLPVANRYRITAPADFAPGLVEAFVVARLGVSSSRVFSIGSLTEVAQTTPSATIKDALAIQIGSTVNSTMIARGMNHYRISAKSGQRVRIVCGSRGVDSKLDPVLVLSSATGRVLATDRLGNGIDHTVEQDGDYIIKVHDLTFQGGPEFFYRLSVIDLGGGSSVSNFASSRHVSQYSWPPHGFDTSRSTQEAEPNDSKKAQQIELPCQISGSFYPAADVDCFEFKATKGQLWWIEIASHRLGAPTGPAANVQRAVSGESGVVWQDVLELKDIAPPMKISSNHYAYDGPPYNGGSTDLIGKFEAPEDGLYRLQLNDLFGGTRDNAGSVYQLAIRPASPDFALTGWVKHIELRNGDRNALSKPLALRPGATIALEVGAFRRDGFNEPIRLEVSGLPDGVTASVIDIPSGQTAGTVLLTADVRAPKGHCLVQIKGNSTVGDQQASRVCQFASMAWPIRDHWQEFPRPRLSQVIPLSVTDGEPHTITIQSTANESGNYHIKATAGTTASIPLHIERRCEFSGSVLALNTLGNGFQGNPRFEIPLQEATAEVKLDLAKLGIAPGTYTIAFFGPAVAKYRDFPTAVTKAEASKQVASQRVEQLKQQLQAVKASEATAAATTSGPSSATVEQELKAAEEALKAADNEVKAATARSQPQDIADIVVTRPFTLEVLPSEGKK